MPRWKPFRLASSYSKTHKRGWRTAPHLTWGLVGGNHQIIKDLSLSPLKREGQISQDMTHYRQGQVCRSLCHMERLRAEPEQQPAHSGPDQRRNWGHLQKELWPWIGEQQNKEKHCTHVSSPSGKTDGHLGCCQEIADEKKLFTEEFPGFFTARNREGKQVQGVCRQLHVQHEWLLLDATLPGVLSSRKTVKARRREQRFLS